MTQYTHPARLTDRAYHEMQKRTTFSCIPLQLYLYHGTAVPIVAISVEWRGEHRGAAWLIITLDEPSDAGLHARSSHHIQLW